MDQKQPVTLRELREEAALSQEELSRKAGISPTTLLEIELGRRSAQPKTRRKLAEALGVEPRSLAHLARTSYRRPTRNQQKTA